MTRSKITIAVGAMLALTSAFYAGVTWNSNHSANRLVAAVQTSPTDAVIVDAEAELAEAQRDFDSAMADLQSPTPSRIYAPNPEIQMGERHAIELNEQICRQTGQNCEFARMARRQYQEKYVR